jgi:hydroxyacylglutathione hydrolase
VIIDAAHASTPIIDTVAGRTVTAVVLTHGHNDHVTVAPELSQRLDTPMLLHPGDRTLWNQTHPNIAPGELIDGQKITVAGTDLVVINTPGHSPGSCSIYAPELGVLFSGDTLFSGGPGATGRSFSSFPTIIESVQTKIFTLPAETKVNAGHGDSTAIGNESPHLEEWIKRGH